MAEAKSSIARRDRGRPQPRAADETRQFIYGAAWHELAARGYAATAAETVARSAGVSTRRPYRLMPNKAVWCEGMVSDRQERVLSDVNLQVLDDADIEAGPTAALMAYADPGLGREVGSHVMPKEKRRAVSAPRLSQIDWRSDLNAARISETKNAGCSHAAKWPPLGSLL
ncbi:MAG: TetR family transcriptional regulator [Rhizobiales bacterium]|nr:TetR family transcriptional regulator [Hyphomicrobiales bacterium]